MSEADIGGMAEADIGGMAVEVESSYQYLFIFFPPFYRQ